MPGYNTIPDSAVDPDAPITTSLMFALRDNPIAMFGAAPGAPVLNRGAISIGGSGLDGAAVDATSIVGSGVYDFSSITLTLAKTLPILTILRCSNQNGGTGIVNISSVVGAAESCLQDRLVLKALGATVIGEVDIVGGTPPPPNVLSNYANTFPNSYGGSNMANTGGMPGIVGTPLFRVWQRLIKNPLLGAGLVIDAGILDPLVACGGGAIIVLADGPIIVSGTLAANGSRPGSGSVSGAAGSIILVSGTSISLAGSTLVAAGGVDVGHGGGVGAGGYIAAVSPVITGTPTINVTGDNGTITSGPGYGLYEQVTTLTQAQINALLLG
jgi:hypothetical protein